MGGPFAGNFGMNGMFDLLSSPPAVSCSVGAAAGLNAENHSHPFLHVFAVDFGHGSVGGPDFDLDRFGRAVLGYGPEAMARRRLAPGRLRDDSDFGFHRNAALGTTSTSVRFGSSNETLAVMYGNSFPSGLSASMMTK